LLLSFVLAVAFEGREIARSKVSPVPSTSLELDCHFVVPLAALHGHSELVLQMWDLKSARRRDAFLGETRVAMSSLPSRFAAAAAAEDDGETAKFAKTLVCMEKLQARQGRSWEQVCFVFVSCLRIPSPILYYNLYTYIAGCMAVPVLIYLYVLHSVEEPFRSD
jgi:hypothetical protein